MVAKRLGSYGNGTRGAHKCGRSGQIAVADEEHAGATGWIASTADKGTGRVVSRWQTRGTQVQQVGWLWQWQTRGMQVQQVRLH